MVVLTFPYTLNRLWMTSAQFVISKVFPQLKLVTFWGGSERSKGFCCFPNLCCKLQTPICYSAASKLLSHFAPWLWIFHPTINCHDAYFLSINICSSSKLPLKQHIPDGYSFDILVNFSGQLYYSMLICLSISPWVFYVFVLWGIVSCFPGCS